MFQYQIEELLLKSRVLTSEVQPCKLVILALEYFETVQFYGKRHSESLRKVIARQDERGRSSLMTKGGKSKLLVIRYARTFSRWKLLPTGQPTRAPLSNGMKKGGRISRRKAQPSLSRRPSPPPVPYFDKFLHKSCNRHAFTYNF